VKTLHLQYQSGVPAAVHINRLRSWLDSIEAPQEVSADMQGRAAKTLAIMEAQGSALDGVGAAMNLKQTIEVAPYRVILHATSARAGLVRRFLWLVTGRG
jgi:hypothetical protein